MSQIATDFVPAPPRTGRTRQFVAELRQHPGEWMFYGQDLQNPRAAGARYQTRYPGTRWDVDAQGRLAAMWVGEQ